MNYKAWIITVDMGYGHQRASFPLRRLSPDGKVIVANNYQGIPRSDYLYWNSGRRFYEVLSRMSHLPVVGKYIFGIMDSFQKIEDFYPHRNLSMPNSFQLRQTYYSIHRGIGKHLIDKLNRENPNIPIITTFFSAAYFAEEHKFKNDIYLVVCDSDVSRTWAPYNPMRSRIRYLCPNRRVVERMKLYGVKEENIFLTGFPLPEENLGGIKLNILKKDLAERLVRLDPGHRYRNKYFSTVKQYLKGFKPVARRVATAPTLTFAVGGAGAQRWVARDILLSLKKKLLTGDLNLNLVAGTRNDVYNFFQNCVDGAGLRRTVGKNLNILFSLDKEDYFKQFNAILRKTDVLWTKPSELVFYSALGLPVIMAPSLGSQEVFNRTWLKTIGAGITQNNPRYVSEWFFDWLESGWLAEAAMSGFLDGRQFGVDNIIDVVFRGKKEPFKDDKLI